MKQIITAILLVIATTGFTQDTIPLDTVDTPYTKYAIITVSDYYNINCDNSQGKNYKIGNKTERTYSMNPTHYCFDEDSVLKVALKVNPTNQIGFEFQLYDFTEINFVDTVLEDIEIELINQNTFDWMARHYDKAGDKSKRWIFINSAIDNGNVPEWVKEKLKTK